MGGVESCFNRDGQNLELLLMRRVCGYCIEKDSRPLSFEEGLFWAKIRQPKNTPIVATKIRKGVAEVLKVPYHEVSFFTTVCSPLDFHEDISGFFEFRGEIVTVSVAMNPHKKPFGRFVDFIIDDGTDIPLVDTIEGIACKFRYKINQKERMAKGGIKRIIRP